MLERAGAARDVQSRSRSFPLGSRLQRVSNWLLSPPVLATLVTALFIAISVAWVLYDGRVQGGDPGRHLRNLFDLRDQILGGAPFAWWHFDPDSGALYPPLVYLIGFAGTLVGGVTVEAPVLALNAVGVPLLALGCYRVASFAYDSRAGALAVIFALGVPMVISLFHIFMFDMVQVALVAASAWLLLETERFSRPGMSMLAGALVGVALLAKPTSAFFIAPLVAVMLFRGCLWDWRDRVQGEAPPPLLRTPTCALLFAGVALLVALPWHLEHADRLRGVAIEASAQGVENPWGNAHPRFSLENFTWYGWSLLNLQLLLPLTVFFAIGLVHAAAKWLRTRSRADYGPELIGGAVGGYLITALVFGYQDARYTMPALVFMAALAAGWIVSLRRPGRIAATVALVSVFMINTAAVNLGFPGHFYLNGAWPVDVGQDHIVRVVHNDGYVVGPPQKGGEVLDLMRAAARDGVEAVGYEEPPPVQLVPQGLDLFSTIASRELSSPINVVSHPDYNPALLGDRGIFLVYRPPGTPWPTPCRRMEPLAYSVPSSIEDGGLYAFRGSPGAIDDSGRLVRPRFENLYCPLP
jgi:hypothetical protein